MKNQSESVETLTRRSRTVAADPDDIEPMNPTSSAANFATEIKTLAGVAADTH